MRHARLGAILIGASAVACTSHRVGVDPIEIKPIRVTVDVNVKVQRQLDDFFDFEDEITDGSEDKGRGDKSTEEKK